MVGHRFLLSVFCLLAYIQSSQAQRFQLFTQKVRDYSPSVLYDFLERYLFEIDSMQTKGEVISQKLHDDKVFFQIGTAASAKKITPDMQFSVSKTDDKFYEVSWRDSLGQVVLDVVFPMQYELILGKPKVEIEMDLKDELQAIRRSFVAKPFANELATADDNCKMSEPQVNYYVKSMNDATYYHASTQNDTLIPTFVESDKWHSAANLFQGVISDVGNRKLYIEQNLYNFQTKQYSVALAQWLRYCQQMQLSVYFSVEEEREDGLKALIIAQNKDLAFNHMMSLIIPNDFVTNANCIIKATLNAYIPTQNVKNLYQQYVKKPKTRI
ncbi:MAG: hypothetical protein MJY90_01585 [Bacteroidaceae bacterium]|nr:hypothetical protein [Bacteroidaceae bacterium]